MRVIFLGTPTFAVPSLSRLLDVGHEVVGVVTQPDRPAGRGRQLRESPVKQMAEKAGLPVIQPVEIRDPEVVGCLRRLQPDVASVVAFGQILPRALLEIPPHGCVNVHASLLPKYRGPAPIPWALIRGETVTGVTIMEVVEAVDAGPILSQRTTPITPEDNAGTLHDRLAVLGADALVETLYALERGEVTRTPQDESLATYAPKLPPALGCLDWSRPAGDLWNLVRGLAPQPGAYSFFRGLLIRVLAAEPLPTPAGCPPGTVVGLRKGAGVEVATGEGTLLLTMLQPEGRRIMTGGEFARGYRVEVKSAFRSTRE
jgi:methionyl-tRNA formyltransferase